MEFGISTFGDIRPDFGAGNAKNAHKRMQEILELASHAENVGLDVIALGEHHRPDFMISAPEVILAAIAAKTSKIKLSSAVTVLSSADPVRVYQNFASLDLISNGRAEIMAGRGSFIESFPLFGYDLQDYDSLFTEKLELLIQINENERVKWKGKHRADIQNLGVYPRAFQGKLPIWIAVGGTPESAQRAGRLNLPMTLAIIGGYPDRFVPFTEMNKRSYMEAGHNPEKYELAINSHFYIAETDEQAANDFYPSFQMLMNRIGKERGWAPVGRDYFDEMRSPMGSLFVGSAESVAEKILYQHSIFGHTRFTAQILHGEIEHEKIMRSVELFGTVVKPMVQSALQNKRPT
ncbi:MAG: LLM class flavin-dependent oxidoreductase [Bacteroidetes bacterium]|nr:LLM class flavin-dependent oxidoreductase [Bacteroidota bacterium]